MLSFMGFILPQANINIRKWLLHFFSFLTNKTFAYKTWIGGPLESSVVGVVRWDLKGTYHIWRPLPYKYQDLGLSVKLH